MVDTIHSPAFLHQKMQGYIFVRIILKMGGGIQNLDIKRQVFHPFSYLLYYFSQNIIYLSKSANKILKKTSWGGAWFFKNLSPGINVLDVSSVIMCVVVASNQPLVLLSICIILLLEKVCCFPSVLSSYYKKYGVLLLDFPIKLPKKLELNELDILLSLELTCIQLAKV